MLLALAFAAGNFQFVAAQLVYPSDTSPASVRKYQGIINRNKEMIEFIEYSLMERGVPKHMKHLAIIESHLNRNIESWVGAKGLWQFMEAHARGYGLSPEERNDVYLSTKVAARSLSNLYKLYNNWVTVIAAYNCGEGNIQKAMRRSGSRKYHEFERFLPEETRNHVKKYLNACYATGELQEVLDNYNSFAGYTAPRPQSDAPAAPGSGNGPAPVSVSATPLPPVQVGIPLKLSGSTKGKAGLGKTVINSAYNLDVIAQFLAVKKTQLIAWNPGLERKLKEKGESDFFLPADMLVSFQMNRSRLLSESLSN